jgi:hypothetical protein
MKLKYLKIAVLFLIFIQKQAFGQISKAKLDSISKNSITIWQYLDLNIDIPNGKYFFNPQFREISKMAFFFITKIRKFFAYYN